MTIAQPDYEAQLEKASRIKCKTFTTNIKYNNNINRERGITKTESNMQTHIIKKSNFAENQ